MINYRENKTYVYALLDPRNNKPFYIGISTKVDRRNGNKLRPYEHGIKRSKEYWNSIEIQNTDMKSLLIRKLINSGYSIDFEILYDNLSWEDACEIEKSLISKYGRRNIDKDGILTNRLSGGDGCNSDDFKIILTEESRKKISEKNKGRKLTKEQRLAISLRNRGEGNPMYGKPSAMRGYKWSEEQRKNISLKNKGREISKYTRDKVIESNKNRRGFKFYYNSKLDKELCLYEGDIIPEGYTLGRRPFSKERKEKFINREYKESTKIKQRFYLILRNILNSNKINFIDDKFDYIKSKIGSENWNNWKLLFGEEFLVENIKKRI